MRIGRVITSALLVAGQIVAMMPVVRADSGSDVVSGVVISHVIGGEAGHQGAELVALYNNTDTVVDVTGYCLASNDKIFACVQKDTRDTSVKTYIPARSSLIVASDVFQTVHAEYYKTHVATVTFVSPDSSGSKIAVSSGVLSLLDDAGKIVDTAAWGASPKLVTGGMLVRMAVVDNPTLLTNMFVLANIFAEYDLPLDTSYDVVTQIIVEPELVTDCAGVVINEIGANTTNQFVELYNATDVSVQLAGCKLQTNRNSKTYTLTQTSVGPGEYVVVNIADTGLALTKTTTGTVYLLSSDGLTENDAVNYSNLLKDTSWARFVDGWRQTYAMTPGTDNVDQAYPPCADGYYRNLATGRCNMVPVDAPLAACAADQFRNPETGRCKKIVTATVTPCKDSQYRSEETNRCRNVVTASTKKPCKDNQYRSEETNRCRNLPVKTVPDAAFAVQPVPDTGSAFVGWWALGGVGLLALGYAIWEWRYEISQFAGAIASRFSAK